MTEASLNKKKNKVLGRGGARPLIPALGRQKQADF